MHLKLTKHLPTGRMFGVAALFALGAIGLCGAASAGTASRSPQAPSVAVSFKDLDLNDARDVGVLYKRIVAASKLVCRSPDAFNLHAQQLVEECRQQAVARAVASIGNQRLNAMLSRHSNAS